MTSEPQESGTTKKPRSRRDYGPYETAEQVSDQIGRGVYGRRAGDTPELHATLILGDALLLSGVEYTSYEEELFRTIAARLGPELAQVVAGLLLRTRASAIKELHPTRDQADSAYYGQVARIMAASSRPRPLSSPPVG